MEGNPLNVKIVKADEARLADCRAVFLDSSLYDHYFSEEGRLEAQLAKAISRGELWMAITAQDEVVGCMWIELDGFFGAFPYLALLGVKKSFRDMGIGHVLLNTFIGVSRELGYRKCSLLVSHFNPRAKYLYQSLGFQKVGYVPDCILPGIHENILVKEL